MFERILLATTASPTCDDAASIAFDLAQKYKSQIHLIHVLGIPSRGFSPFITDVRTGEMENLYDHNYLALVKEEMRHTYEKQLAGYPPAQVEAVVGVPHTEILRKARKMDADLIVMGTHTRIDDVGSSRFRGVVGSTMQKVAKAARCPVLIISRPCTTCWWYFSNIVVGVDFSKASLSAFLFGMKAAREIPCRLYIFHVLDLRGQELSQPEIEARLEQARKRIEEMYLPHLDGFEDFQIDVWEGVPHVEILKYARQREADLIVMAHHTREVDPEKALLGSTVEQVVLRAACPVASVNRPDKVSD
ncbi:MAG: universal stress protein [Pseudomonadota bacterium]